MSGHSPAAKIALPARASAPTEVWTGEFGRREYALLGASLGALFWILPPLQGILFGATVLTVYGIGRTSFSRDRKLLMVLPVLALLLAAKQKFPRPAVEYVLWSGGGLEAFFVLRCIDWAVSKPPKGFTDGLADRVGRYLLFLFFLPTLFSGPVVTYRDFYRSYAPGRVRSRSELGAHIGKILLGALKFYALQGYVLEAATRARTLADAGANLFGILDARLLLWTYVFLYLVQFYVGFSGFSDIATGVSRILGFQLYENFERPLFSSSPVQYWRRMHVSVYRWLMTHVFYPYWRHDQITRKVLTVFLASALWHVSISRRVTADVVVQIFMALAVYGMSVALLLRLSGTDIGRRIAGLQTYRYGFLILWVQIASTFAFAALIHQIFWPGMTGRPIGANVRLFRRLFLPLTSGVS